MRPQEQCYSEGDPFHSLSECEIIVKDDDNPLLYRSYDNGDDEDDSRGESGFPGNI